MSRCSAFTAQRRARVVITAGVTAVLAAGCATSAARPGASDGLSAGPRPRMPVLDSCPAGGSSSALPRLTLRCLASGPSVDTAALGGKPVLVNLWASWCVPCQREMPALQKAFAASGGRVAFLGVDTEDEPNSARDFLAAVGVHYPQVTDDPGNLLHGVGGSGLPLTLVLDGTGKVVFSRRGQLHKRDLATALARVDPASAPVRSSETS